MKKIFFLIALVFFFTTGCGTINQEPLKKATANLTDAQSYEMVVTVTSEIDDMKVVNTIYMDKSTETTHIIMKVETQDMNFEMDAYSKVEGDKLITYSKNPFLNDYMKEESDVDEDFNSAQGYNLNFELLESDFEFKKLSSNGDVSVYEVYLDKDLIGNAGITNIDPFVITVNKDQITSITTKFYDGQQKTFTINYEFKGINTTEVSIPQTIIDNAK
jgi:hypothetical protein